MTYLDNHHFLHDNRYGFRKGRSCESQLAPFLHDIQKAGDSKTKFDPIFLDFKKAFEQVPHKTLIHKLQSCGVNEKQFIGFETYSVTENKEYLLTGLAQVRLQSRQVPHKEV
jgi:hypothetical protein